MELKFIGGAREVGSSCVKLTDKDKRILFDYGMRVHSTQERPDEVELADYLIVTHSHLDHFGFLPIFYRHVFAAASPQAPAAQTFCTQPTIPLMNLLFEDTIRIASREQKPPPFTPAEMKRATRHCSSMPYDSEFVFPNGTSFELLDAGHIQGSSLALYRGSKKTVLYTGDMNFSETKMHRAAQLPKEPVDTLIIESTYAVKDHPSRAEIEKDFCSVIKETVDEKGIALVPCFAIGRTQELLQVLYDGKVDCDIYLDGMGVEATKIMLDFPEYLKDPNKLQKAFERVAVIEHNKKVALRKPGVIIATAGMLEGGPILEYLVRVNRIKNSRVLLTGFQAPRTNGRRLVEEGKIRVGRHFEKISLEVHQYDFSAHSGKKELFDYVRKVNPEKVFTVHGDEKSCISFADDLKKEGIDAVSPKVGEKFQIA